MRKNSKNGDEIVPELANMKEMGKTRILEGIFGNAAFILKLKYEDSRRHSNFEHALSEQLGFDVNKFHVFILEMMLKDNQLQTQPDSTSSHIEKHLTKLELSVISLRLQPQNLNNIDLSTIKLEKPTMQGQMYLTLHNSPISLTLGQKTFRYVFFDKDFDFSDIKTAELMLADNEKVILKAIEKKYPISPTIPKTTD